MAFLWLPRGGSFALGLDTEGSLPVLSVVLGKSLVLSLQNGRMPLVLWASLGHKDQRTCDGKGSIFGMVKTHGRWRGLSCLSRNSVFSPQAYVLVENTNHMDKYTKKVKGPSLPSPRLLSKPLSQRPGAIMYPSDHFCMLLDIPHLVSFVK